MSLYIVTLAIRNIVSTKTTATVDCFFSPVSLPLQMQPPVKQRDKHVSEVKRACLVEQKNISSPTMKCSFVLFRRNHILT